MHDNSSIPTKANRILYLTLCALALIAIRLWHLVVIQYEEKFEESKRPQRRVIVEAPSRATLRDRFNLPLAVNKVAYRAAVAYSPIRHVPAVSWEVDTLGKKSKIYKRKAYVRSLAELLSNELDLDADRVVDLIYSKAALYFHIPYVLKEELTEKEYYRLKMLEKDWPGLIVERYIHREYPKGKCACDLIGYMGAISRSEYEANMQEKRGLELFLAEWENGENPPLPENFQTPYEVRKRFKDLQEMAYTAHDFVGKAGIEALFEEQLRGFQGKRSYYSDSKGNILKELPGGQAPMPGKRVLLSISRELQEYAETLLAQVEDLRQAKVSGFNKQTASAKQPWIKGGAIVALDPHSGEVLAMASYPRFDPNDFVVTGQSETARLKRQSILRWLESDSYIAALWNQIHPLRRERYDSENQSFYEEEKWITWPTFLELMLPKTHLISSWFAKQGTVQEVVKILEQVDEWEKVNNKPISEGLDSDNSLAKTLEFLPTPYSKLLFLDLCQLSVFHTAFSKTLLKQVGNQSIELHHEACSAFVQVQEGVKEIARDIFHTTVFKRWRELHEKKFLKERREWEKQSKTYAKPYIDYLDEKERELFNRFWILTRYDFCLALLTANTGEKNHLKPFTAHFIQLHKELEEGAHPALPWRQAYQKLLASMKGLSPPVAQEYLTTMRSYQDLTRPLKGKYRQLRNKKGPPLEKHLAAGFYPLYGFGYGRSNAYRQSASQGSIFKLITAYEALMQQNEKAVALGKELNTYNPLDLTDETFKIGQQTFVGYTEQGLPIPQLYKGGRLPRSYGARKGKMNLLHAIETSSNVYFSLLAGDVMQSPLDLAEAAKRFGFGEKTGIELPAEIPGKVPTDLEDNRTGLYALAIGQHSLVVTPIQTALLFATLANHGNLLQPHIIKALATSTEGRDEMGLDVPLSPQQALELATLGIDFPLFGQPVSQKKLLVDTYLRTLRRHIPMPDSLRHFLLQALHRVVLRTQADSLWMLSKLYADYPEAISDYIDLKHQLVGKTSTAESMERIDFDENDGTNLYTHVWFGGIAFEDDVNVSFARPELVVVVYLRFGSYGKEAAPLAAQMVHKWREIKAQRTIPN